MTETDQEQRDLILTSDHSTDESTIESKIQSKYIYAFGADRIIHSARISVLDSERLSNLRYLVISDEAIYIFDDQDFERRIPNEHITEIVKYQDSSTSISEQKSHRLLFRVNNDSDVLIISKGASGVLEALEKTGVYTFSNVDPAEDLFSKARFVETCTHITIDSLKESLQQALQSVNLKKVMLNLELLRRNNQVDWNQDSLILQAIEFVKSK